MRVRDGSREPCIDAFEQAEEDKCDRDAQCRQHHLTGLRHRPAHTSGRNFTAPPSSTAPHDTGPRRCATLYTVRATRERDRVRLALLQPEGSRLTTVHIRESADQGPAAPPREPAPSGATAADHARERTLRARRALRVAEIEERSGRHHGFRAHQPRI